ncbi:hypothetical protein [Thalassobacillus devorans]|uniref:hypothetical protein n=1 Tax=Thalassobacillus devorans TaxID=279813 RepID=UPI000A1C8F91|nr:hypothetical protein [Thalassobacillus devorans]
MTDIKLAEKHQGEEIFNLYQACGEVLTAQSILQWDENYPGREFVQEAIDQNDLYVCQKAVISLVQSY